MAGYLGAVPVPQATQHRDTFTATDGQTTFNVQPYTPTFLDVYLNGVRLNAADVTATNGTSVVLVACETDDIVDVISYAAFEVGSLSANSVDSDQYVDGSIDTVHIADQAINEAKMQISNAPTNGYALTAQSGNTGGMTWAAAGAESLGDLSDLTISTTYPALNTNPSSGVGHVWLNKTIGSQYILIDASSGANVWANADHNRPGVAPMAASGGTEATSGGYKYHTFTSNGTFTIGSGFVGGVSSLEVLAIGGGASGSKGLAGDYPGGGAGAGQVKLQSFSPVAPGAYTIIIGSGGGARNDNTDRDYGIAGETSQVKLGTTVFVEASGGGAGGGGDNDNTGASSEIGQNSGGSGGGGGNGGGTGGLTTGFPSDRFTEVGGNDGGDAVSGGNRGSGGGGGAGAAGQDGTTTKSGNGGAGTNEYSAWATATSTGVSGYYAGGGGGAPYNNANQAGLGGAGGGGAGALNAEPASGAANTGSGGGAFQGSGNTYNGSAGGSGLVIIRYAV